MAEKIKVIAVLGPTASGKTGIAIDLAQRFGGEIISADSMQIYKYMDIGSAKPNASERKRAVHHLVDFSEPCEEFSVADYVSAAREKIKEISSAGKLPIIAGGTGLYMDSLLSGVDFGESRKDEALRERLRAYAEENGAEALHEMLAAKDPVKAAEIHPNNIGRVIRAIEYFELTGRKMSDAEASSKKESGYDVLRIGLDFSAREKLYERIDARVDKMISDGLCAEAEKVRGLGMSKTAAQAIGYKEIFAYLDGEKSLEECVCDIKNATHHYAKRQLTWFKRDKSTEWFYRDGYGSDEELSRAVLSRAEKFLGGQNG